MILFLFISFVLSSPIYLSIYLDLRLCLCFFVSFVLFNLSYLSIYLSIYLKQMLWFFFLVSLSSVLSSLIYLSFYLSIYLSRPKAVPLFLCFFCSFSAFPIYLSIYRKLMLWFCFSFCVFRPFSCLLCIYVSQSKAITWLFFVISESEINSETIINVAMNEDKQTHLTSFRLLFGSSP